MKNLHLAFLIVVVAIIVVIPPAITGGAISIDKTLKVDPAEKIDVQLNDTSIWTSIFKGLFRAIIEVDKEQNLPDTRDDVVQVDEPLKIPGADKLPKPGDNLPCDVKLGFCNDKVNSLQSAAEDKDAELQSCNENLDVLESDLDSCQSVEDQFDETMASLRNPTPPGGCTTWISRAATSCNEVCASKNKGCYGAMIRDLGYEFGAYMCAPSNCYDLTTPRCNDQYIPYGREDEPFVPARDCLCC